MMNQKIMLGIVALIAIIGIPFVLFGYVNIGGAAYQYIASAILVGLGVMVALRKIPFIPGGTFGWFASILLIIAGITLYLGYWAIAWFAF